MPAPRKVSDAQLEELVAWMELHTLQARASQFESPRAKQVSHRLWDELTSRLNAVGDGVTKTSKEWRQYWSDRKCKAKKKGAEMQKNGSGTDGGPSWDPILTPIEERILVALRGPAMLKRYRLDESSPRGEAKRLRVSTPHHSQTVSYPSAVRSDLVAAITNAKTGHLSRARAEDVKEHMKQKFLDYLRPASDDELGPKFLGKPTYVDGMLQVWCADTRSLDWLKATIGESCLPSGEVLAVMKPSDIVRRVYCYILIPGVYETRDIGKALRIQNQWAQVNRWLLHRAIQQHEDTFLILSIPEDIVETIVENNRCLSFFYGEVYVKFRGPKGKFTDIPPPYPDQDAEVEEPAIKSEATVQELAAASPHGSVSELSESHSDLLGPHSVSDGEDDWTQRIEGLQIKKEMPDGVTLE